MSDLHTHPLLITDTLAVWDVMCAGTCRHKSAEECACETSIVFPYRGVYVRHVGRTETIAEANHVIFFNKDEPYRVSHPIAGGDSNLSVRVTSTALQELAPAGYLQGDSRVCFNRASLRVDARAQALAALVRHQLEHGVIETLEAETLTLTLVRRALGEHTSHASSATTGRQKLVDRAKLALASDLDRRWTLAEVAAEIGGVSPVYLTQMFQQVEGLPLYRYQLQLRLARALDLLAKSADLTRLGLDLGFSSYSHFSAAFKRAYAQTPAEFQRSAQTR